AEDGIRDFHVTGVQTCALPILDRRPFRFILVRVLADQPDRPLPHLRRVLLCSCHGSNFSRVGASGKPGAIHFGRVLSAMADSSAGSVDLGQEAAKISYVLRPRRNAPALVVHSVMISTSLSSKYGTSQPPWRKSLSRSSSGPPGACITPSSVRNVPTTIFLMLPSVCI